MSDETPAIDNITIDTGPVHYRLDVPALGLPHYRLLQVVVWRRLVQSRKRKAWRNILIACVIGGLIGGLGGFGTSYLDLRMEFWIGYGRAGGEWLFDGFDIFLGAIGLFLLSVIAFRLLVVWNMRWQLKLLHEANSSVLGPHELLIGEKGIGWRGAGRHFFVEWPKISGLQQEAEMTFIIAEHVTAFWLPEAVLKAMPDREGFMAFLRTRIPA